MIHLVCRLDILLLDFFNSFHIDDQNCFMHETNFLVEFSEAKFLFPSPKQKDFDLEICNDIMWISKQVIDQMAWNATIAMNELTEALISIKMSEDIDGWASIGPNI